MRIRYRPNEATLRGHALDRLVQAAHPIGGQDPAIHPVQGGTVLDWCRAGGIGYLVVPHEVVAQWCTHRRLPQSLDTRPSSPMLLTQRALLTLHERGVVDRVGMTTRYRPSGRPRG